MLLITDALTGLRRNRLRLPLFAGGTSLFKLEIGGGFIPFSIVPEKTEAQIRIVSVSQNNTAVDAILAGFLYDAALWP